MNLKIKKRVISMLCATVMVASSMGASVGAIKIVPNCTQKSKDAVLKSNQTLECSTAGLTKLKDNIQKLKLKLNNQHDDAVENIIAKLIDVIGKINNWYDYYIADENLVVEIQNEITNLNDQIIDLNSNCLSKQPDLVIQSSTNIFNKIETINNKLLEENRKSLFKKELNDKYKEYYKEVEGFHRWKDRYNISEGLDTIYENIRCVEEYYKSTREKADADVVEKFSELATKLCKEMEQFKSRKAFFWKELDDKYKEYRRRVEEFCTWGARNNIVYTIHGIRARAILDKISYFEKYYRFIRPNANAAVVNKISELETTLCKDMEEFKNRILARQRFMRNMLMQKIHFIWLI